MAASTVFVAGKFKIVTVVMIFLFYVSVTSSSPVSVVNDSPDSVVISSIFIMISSSPDSVSKKAPDSVTRYSSFVMITSGPARMLGPIVIPGPNINGPVAMCSFYILLTDVFSVKMKFVFVHIIFCQLPLQLCPAHQGALARPCQSQCP